MPALACSPSNLTAVKACLNCMSEKQLKAVIVYAMRTSAGLDLPTLNLNAACYMCLSKKEMLVALTAMITNQLTPTLSVNDLRNGTPCKMCGSDKQLEAMMLYLFCNYFQSTAV